MEGGGLPARRLDSRSLAAPHYRVAEVVRQVSYVCRYLGQGGGWAVLPTALLPLEWAWTPGGGIYAFPTKLCNFPQMSQFCCNFWNLLNRKINNK